jgi:hypothetical protein
MSPGTRSNSWASRHAELDAGTVIHGFRIERLLGRGSLGTVYEATQLSLGRTVALRLLEQALFSDPGFSARLRQQQRLSASVHHPNIVPTYEAGDFADGRFVAARYVRGRTLADLLEDGSLSPSRSKALLGPIASALDTAHEAGLVHGRVTPQNLLVDAEGTAYLADLGLGRPGSVAADREALAALVSQAERAGGRRRPRSFARLAATGLAGLAVVATAVAVVGDGEGGGDAEAEPPPRIAAGAVPLGSELAPGAARSFGCSREPGPNTPACTLSQSTIAGRSMAVREAGVIRRWAVRGAAGDLALQVIRRRDGRAFLGGFSQVERVPDAGPHGFEASVRVERGDRVGVLLAPGAAIGARTVSRGTSASRWEGTLEFTPRPQSSSRLRRELLLRADIEFGARPEPPPQRTGSRAAAAEDGRTLEELVIPLSGSRVVRVALVRVRSGIALDAFRDRRRVARIDVPDARPSGRLLSVFADCGYRRGFCFRWLNEGELTPVLHAYTLARDGGAFRLIG